MAGQEALSDVPSADAVNGEVRIDRAVITAAIWEFFERRGMMPGPSVHFENVSRRGDFGARVTVFYRPEEPEPDE